MAARLHHDVSLAGIEQADRASSVPSMILDGSKKCAPAVLYAGDSGVEVADFARNKSSDDILSHIASRLVPRSDIDGVLALASTAVLLQHGSTISHAPSLGAASFETMDANSMHIIAMARGRKGGQPESRGKIAMYVALRANSGDLLVSRPVMEVHTVVGSPCVSMDLCTIAVPVQKGRGSGRLAGGTGGRQGAAHGSAYLPERDAASGSRPQLCLAATFEPGKKSGVHVWKLQLPPFLSAAEELRQSARSSPTASAAFRAQTSASQNALVSRSTGQAPPMIGSAGIAGTGAASAASAGGARTELLKGSDAASVAFVRLAWSDAQREQLAAIRGRVIHPPAVAGSRSSSTGRTAQRRGGPAVPSVVLVVASAGGGEHLSVFDPQKLEERPIFTWQPLQEQMHQGIAQLHSRPFAAKVQQRQAATLLPGLPGASGGMGSVAASRGGSADDSRGGRNPGGWGIGMPTGAESQAGTGAAGKATAVAAMRGLRVVAMGPAAGSINGQRPAALQTGWGLLIGATGDGRLAAWDVGSAMLEHLRLSTRPALAAVQQRAARFAEGFLGGHASDGGRPGGSGDEGGSTVDVQPVWSATMPLVSVQRAAASVWNDSHATASSGAGGGLHSLADASHTGGVDDLGWQSRDVPDLLMSVYWGTNALGERASIAAVAACWAGCRESLTWPLVPSLASEAKSGTGGSQIADGESLPGSAIGSGGHDRQISGRAHAVSSSSVAGDAESRSGTWSGARQDPAALARPSGAYLRRLPGPPSQLLWLDTGSHPRASGVSRAEPAVPRLGCIIVSKRTDGSPQMYGAAFGKTGQDNGLPIGIFRQQRSESHEQDVGPEGLPVLRPAAATVHAVPVGQALVNSAVAVAPGGFLATTAHASRYTTVSAAAETGIVLHGPATSLTYPATRDEIGLLRRLRAAGGVDLVPLLAAVAAESDKAQFVQRASEPLSLEPGTDVAQGGIVETERTSMHLFLVFARDCRRIARETQPSVRAVSAVRAAMRRRWSAVAPALVTLLRDEAHILSRRSTLSDRGAAVGELVELTHALAWAARSLRRRDITANSTAGKRQYRNSSFPEWIGLLERLLGSRDDAAGDDHELGDRAPAASGGGTRVLSNSAARIAGADAASTGSGAASSAAASAASETRNRVEPVKLGSLIAKTSPRREVVLGSIGWPRLDKEIADAEKSRGVPFVDPESVEADEEADALGLNLEIGSSPQHGPKSDRATGAGEAPLYPQVEPLPFGALPPPQTANTSVGPTTGGPAASGAGTSPRGEEIGANGTPGQTDSEHALVSRLEDCVRQLGLHPADDLPETAQPIGSRNDASPAMLPGDSPLAGVHRGDVFGAVGLSPDAAGSPQSAKMPISGSQGRGPAFNLHSWFDSVLDSGGAEQLWQRVVAPQNARSAKSNMFSHGVGPHSTQPVPNVPLPALLNEVLTKIATTPLPPPLSRVVADALRASCYSRAAVIAASHGAPRAASRVLQVHSAWLGAQARSLKEAADAAEQTGMPKLCVSALQQQAMVLQRAAEQRTRASDHVAEFPAQFASAQTVAGTYKLMESIGAGSASDDDSGGVGAAQARADHRSSITEMRPQLEALRRWSVKCAAHARAVATGAPWLAALSWLLRGQVLSVLPPKPLRIAAGVSQANALTPRLGPITGDDGHQSVHPAAIGSRIMSLRRLPLTDRLGFLCRFASTLELKQVTRATLKQSIRQGRLEALPLTGLGKVGVELLQRYVDRPGRSIARLHIAAILGCYAAPWALNERSAQRVVDWMVSLRNWLNSRRLWQARAALDCDRGRLARAAAAALQARVLAASKPAEPLRASSVAVSGSSRGGRSQRGSGHMGHGGGIGTKGLAQSAKRSIKAASAKSSGGDIHARFASASKGTQLPEPLAQATQGRVPLATGASRRLLAGLPDPGGAIPSAYDETKSSRMGRVPVQSRFLKARQAAGGGGGAGSAVSVVSSAASGGSDGPQLGLAVSERGSATAASGVPGSGAGGASGASAETSQVSGLLTAAMSVPTADHERAMASQAAAKSSEGLQFDAQAAALVLAFSRGAQHAELQAKCGSCGTVLVLPELMRKGRSMKDWIQKQRPKVIQCINCKRELPRCSLCLLPMGCINPVMQINEDDLRRRGATAGFAGGMRLAMQQQSSPTSSAATGPGQMPTGGVLSDPVAEGVQSFSDDAGVLPAAPQAQQRTSLAFGEFWSWCQSCRHGGHASHLATWFASNDICPVATCACRCRQLDRHAVGWQGAFGDGEDVAERKDQIASALVDDAGMITEGADAKALAAYEEAGAIGKQSWLAAWTMADPSDLQ